MGDPIYITPEGAKAMQEELARLRREDRPKVVREVADAAAQGDRSENAEYIYGKKKLREIDRRMLFLMKRLESVTVVPERQSEEGRIFFGAWVEISDEDDVHAVYRIVGIDEVDLKKGHISWRSPLGASLLKKKAGDSFTFRRPTGEVEITIEKVSYGPFSLSRGSAPK